LILAYSLTVDFGVSIN